MRAVSLVFARDAAPTADLALERPRPVTMRSGCWPRFAGLKMREGAAPVAVGVQTIGVADDLREQSAVAQRAACELARQLADRAARLGPARRRSVMRAHRAPGVLSGVVVDGGRPVCPRLSAVSADGGGPRPP
jgi:hypothetical protein